RSRGGVQWLLARVPLQVGHRLGDGLEVIGVLLRDVEPELFLERHHQLDDVERVRPEILDELGLRRELLHVDFQFLGDDLLDLALVERCHVGFTSCGDGFCGFRYCFHSMTMPPSTVQVWPVTVPARGEARKAITPATSSGVPRRPSGMRALSSACAVSGSFSVISVVM